MVLKLVAGLFVFIIRTFATSLPYCYLHRHSRSGDKRVVSLSICNCIACGIFLSVCFLGLIPHVRQEENAIRAKWNATTHGDEIKRDILLSTELVVMLGFLMILITEQVAVTCSLSGSHSKTSPCTNAPPSLRSLLDGESEDGQPLVDTTLDDHDDGMQDIVFRSASPVERNVHHHVHHSAPREDGISARTLFLLFGLSTHSFFEGVALGVQNDKQEFLNLLFAIMCHEVFCCIAYGIAMAQQSTPVRSAFPTVIILAGTIPLGMFLASLLSQVNSDSLLLRFILEGLAAGAFIYAACVQMLSAELKNDCSPHHADTHGHHENVTEPSSPFQGLAKAVAVTFGVIGFWGLKLATSGHR